MHKGAVGVALVVEVQHEEGDITLSGAELDLVSEYGEMVLEVGSYVGVVVGIHVCEWV